MIHNVIRKLQLPGFGWKNFRGNQKYWVAAMLLVLLSVAGYSAYSTYANSQKQASATSSQMQTAVASTGELVVSASGAGQVIPATEVSIGFDESGTLSEILVSVGEKVQAGQALARLQTDRTEEEVSLAVAQAELDVLTAQQALDEIYKTPRLPSKIYRAASLRGLRRSRWLPKLRKP
jgi:multidrug efflux pump subunit AcrA (membrane-fusion protein)